jgi:hypothetical protein
MMAVFLAAMLGGAPTGWAEVRPVAAVLGA